MSVQISFVPKPSGGHGPASSEDFNDMIASVQKDLDSLAASANVNEASIRNVAKVLFEEFINARNSSARYIEDVRNASKIKAAKGEDIDNFISFRVFRGPEFYLSYEGIAAARRARVETTYGHVLLPYNYSVNRMYAIDPETGDTILASGVEASVTGENESGGVVTAGDVLKAFNGQNQDYWIRKVAFPIEHDVSDVACTIEVATPDIFAGRANMLTIHPYPLGQLDIEEILYSVDSSTPSIPLPSFSIVRGAGFTRWVFPPISMTKFSIKLRQRNAIEENGKKTFCLGAQEIGLSLVEFDQTSGEVQKPDNNSLVAVIEAPSGYYFAQLKRLFTVPSYATALTETGIRVYIFTDEALTNQVWSSYDDPSLADTPVDVSSGSFTKLYLLINLQFLTTGITPVLDDLEISYDLTT